MQTYPRFLILFASLVLIGFCAFQRHLLLGIYHNNKSVFHLSKKMNYEALGEAIEALRYLPFASELHLNLGDLYLLNKDFEKAQKEFLTSARSAAHAHNDQMKFHAFFNAAIAATELKHIDEALSLYQDCLDIQKDSLETKTNIELLIQSQSGGGKGEGGGKSDANQDQKDDKDNKSDRNDPNKKFQNEAPKNQPQPYKGKEISKENVNKILDELKQQEQNIRAKFENRNNHHPQNEKDW